VHGKHEYVQKRSMEGKQTSNIYQLTIEPDISKRPTTVAAQTPKGNWFHTLEELDVHKL
jgi:hypothetical protein